MHSADVKSRCTAIFHVAVNYNTSEYSSILRKVLCAEVCYAIVTSMKIFAHRGWAEGEGENTLLAFKKSVKERVDGVEFDVRYGVDGKSVVVSHDRVDGDSPLALDDALQYLRSSNLELLIELKEYSDDFFVLITQHLRRYNLVGKTTIFAFPGIAELFPWTLRHDIRLGIIAPYPKDIKKYVEKHKPNTVLLGWGNNKERLIFKIFWKFFSLGNIFLKYPSIKFIVGVAYREKDRHWLSKHAGIYGATADMPLS